MEIKLIKNKSSYSDANYIWSGWAIEKVDGLITNARWQARHSDGRWFWQYTLKGIKEMLPIAETAFETIKPMYKNPLY